jgi:hypothetical protein
VTVLPRARRRGQSEADYRRELVEEARLYDQAAEPGERTQEEPPAKSAAEVGAAWGDYFERLNAAAGDPFA